MNSREGRGILVTISEMELSIMQNEIIIVVIKLHHFIFIHVRVFVRMSCVGVCVCVTHNFYIFHYIKYVSRIYIIALFSKDYYFKTCGTKFTTLLILIHDCTHEHTFVLSFSYSIYLFVHLSLLCICCISYLLNTILIPF